MLEERRSVADGLSDCCHCRSCYSLTDLEALERSVLIQTRPCCACIPYVLRAMRCVCLFECPSLIMTLRQCRANEEEFLAMHGFEALNVLNSLCRDMYPFFKLVGTSIQIDIRLVEVAGMAQ